MQSIQRLLSKRLENALAACYGMHGAATDPLLRPAQNPQFGDYQANCAMALSKTVGEKPRDVAQRVVDALQIDDVCDSPEIAGPGFINLRLKPAFVAEQLMHIPHADDADRLGIPPADDPETVVVDLSSPNLAKEMHVGHLRSTVIGDCIARLLEFAGHDVHRVNHIGDWGTQFGMLLAHLRDVDPGVLDDPGSLRLGNLEQFYVEAKQHFDGDAEFADQARRTVVALQGGDPATRTIWKAFCDESMRHCQAVYDLLDVELETRGESYYNNRLAEVVQVLEDADLTRVSEGALCVFPEGFTTRDGDPLPMIVRKTDGGFGYSATDLAAVRHRVIDLGARRIVYVVGTPQKQHFEMLFAVVRKAGWDQNGTVQFTHVDFGSMLAADGRPFKTREGGTVKLKDLLAEAIARARKVIESNEADPAKHRGFSAAEMDDIARTVGMGAVKYYDLAHNRTSDYRFAFDQMLAMDGNTAPYMLYAYARIRSIGRESGVAFESLPADAPITLEHPSELGLAKTLLRLPDALESASSEYRPNILTDYLYELSKSFNLFYDRRHGVRVKDAEPESLRISRLRLCDLTARALRLGLSLLGIHTVEKM